MPDNIPIVFISHAGPDADQALHLQRALNTVGIKAHLDQVDLRLGDNIIKWMNDAVGESDYLLILVSNNSVGRYWVETEWSAALAREADLRRAFVLPVILPGIENSAIPILLRSKLSLDMREDGEAALLKLINFLKQDQQVARDRGRLPTPAPMCAHDELLNNYNQCTEWLNVIVHSNRFARIFRFSLPQEATASYILTMIRSNLNLKWNNIDSDLMVELSYTYAIGFNGKHLPLNTPISECGVKHGAMLELWIRVTLTDLLQRQDKSKDIARWLDGTEDNSLMDACKFVACRTTMHCKKSIDNDIKKASVKIEADRIMKLLLSNRDFTSTQIAMIADKYFSHVDA